MSELPSDEELGVELDEDEDEPLDMNGAERRHGSRDGVDRKAFAAQAAAEERATFVRHIARLQRRLEVYEPNVRRDVHGRVVGAPVDEDDAEDGLVVLGASEDPALRAKVDNLTAQLVQVRRELAVTEDANREHVRQKARLRERIDELSAEVERLRATEGTPSERLFGALRARLDAMPADMERLTRHLIGQAVAAVTAESFEGVPILEEPTFDALDRREAARVAPAPQGAPSAPAAPAEGDRARIVPAGSPAAATGKRDVIEVLGELGEGTIPELAAACRRTAGAIQQALWHRRDRITSRRDGRVKVYRLLGASGVSKATNDAQVV